MIRRLVTLAALGCGLAIALPAPALAQGDPPCPTSIRPVAGGAGDATSNGYDDGARGDDARFAPGQLIVAVQPGTTRAELACVARELGGSIADGGLGRRGIAGIDNTVLIQLDPGVSVRGTDALLSRGAYRDIIDFVTPNDVVEPQAAPVVNDPLFPIQWGISNQRLIPRTNQNPLAPLPAGGVLDPTWLCPAYDANGNRVSLPCVERTMSRLSKRWSMRVRQAWQLLARMPVTHKVILGIVDDSLWDHPDLQDNVSAGGSRTFVAQEDGASVTITAAAPFTFQVRRAQSCPMPARPTAEQIRSALEKEEAVLCGTTSTTTYILTLAATAGSFQLRTLDGSTTLAIPYNASADEIHAELVTNTGLRSLVDSQVVVTEIATDRAASADPVRAFRISFADRSAPLRLQAIDDDLVGAAPGARMVENGYVVEADPQNAARWTIAATNPTDIPLAVVPRDAATIDGSTDVKVIRPPNGPWPEMFGQTNSSHGQNIAGMIGATADNGIGMTGVLGTWRGVSISGLVTKNFFITEIAAAVRYAAEDLRAHVVNVSIGGGYSPTALPGFKQEDPVDPALWTRAISSVGPDSRTLFVVSSANYGENVSDQAVRRRAPLSNNQRHGLSPCRPKGMGVVQRPADLGGQAQAKGGTLSKLQMPDGTYDRGNLLCVAAANWDGKLADFTNWGRNVVDVAAPGVAIVGTNQFGGYDIGNGTSYAAPYAAAVAAMVYGAYPNAKPWLVKCAILSSATTKPLRDPVASESPFTGYAVGDRPGDITGGSPLTVNGMVQASAAISAAGSLQRRVTEALDAERAGGNPRWPTCVQKRGLLGGWVNTPVQ